MYSLAEENYLKAIYHLEHETKGEVSTNAIAERMATKPSSATDMMRKLADKKLLSYKRYKGVLLTPEGRKTAANVIRKHRRPSREKLGHSSKSPSRDVRRFGGPSGNSLT